MKKIFTVLLAFFAFSLCVFASNPGVTFLLRSGQKVSFTFTEKPAVTFGEANLSISVRGVERVSYAYADVARIVMEDDVVSAVNNAVVGDNNPHVAFNLSANILSVSGLPAGNQLSLYATDGKLMLSVKANAEGSAIVSLSALQQGVYVVRTQSGISYKLFKK